MRIRTDPRAHRCFNRADYAQFYPNDSHDRVHVQPVVARMTRVRVLSAGTIRTVPIPARSGTGDAGELHVAGVEL